LSGIDGDATTGPAGNPRGAIEFRLVEVYRSFTKS